MSSQPVETNEEDSPQTPLASPERTSHEASLENMPAYDLNHVETSREDPKSPDTIAFELEQPPNEDAVPEGKLCGKFEYSTKQWEVRPYHPSKYKQDSVQLQNEFFAGITVALAQLAESVAFAFIAGVPPLTGLHAAWIIGLFTSAFGSRPGMINGATGVRAAIIAPYVLQYGNAYLFYIVITISIFQFLAGVFKLAKLVQLVPRSVMIGFVDGLAIILGMGQILTFRVRPNPNTPLVGNATRVYTKINDMPFISDPTTLTWMWVYVVVVAATIKLIPLIPKYGERLPASLIGIGLVTFVEHVCLRPNNIKTPIIGEVAKVQGGFPILFFADPQYAGQIPPYFSWETLSIVTMPAFIAAAAGAVEAVMTMEVVNDMTETDNQSPNQHLFALSLGNFVSALFGTMGGGATIGLSVLNCVSGANGMYRISGIVAGITVLIFVLAASAFIEAIPTASLVGVMVIVVTSIFDWESLQIVLTTMLPMRMRDKIDAITLNLFGKKVSFSGHRKIKRSDAITIVLVVVVTLAQDLFVAVAVGIVYTATTFAWDVGTRMTITDEVVKDKDGNVVKKIYKMHGPLFFASAQRFVAHFKPKHDPKLIEIHFLEADAYVDDYSAIHALNVVGEKYAKYDAKVTVRHLNLASKKLVKKSMKLVKSFTVEEEAEDDDVVAEETAANVDEGAPESTSVSVDNDEDAVMVVEVESVNAGVITENPTVHRRNLVNSHQ